MTVRKLTPTNGVDLLNACLLAARGETIHLETRALNPNGCAGYTVASMIPGLNNTDWETVYDAVNEAAENDPEGVLLFNISDYAGAPYLAVIELEGDEGRWTGVCTRLIKEKEQPSDMDDGNGPGEFLLCEAGKWIDRYRPYDGWSRNDPNIHVRAFSAKVERLTKDLRNSLDCFKHLALYTGKLWLLEPARFAGLTSSLVALPNNLSGLEGVEYDKAVLETLTNRCARTLRWADVNLGAGWYMTDIESPDPSDNSDKLLIDIIRTFSVGLPYETSPERLLDLLLGKTWELYLRAWERGMF
mgnify:CR=1 FL=1|jgi:hypothetical protein